MVFPSNEYPSPAGGNYLPSLSTEKYVIAVRKTDSKLLEIIDDEVLADLKDRKSELGKAMEKIELFEKGQNLNTNIFQQTFTPDPKPIPSPTPIPNWWENATVIAAIIAAFATIMTAILNPQLIGNILNWIKGKKSSQQIVTGRVLNNTNGAWIPGAKVSLEANGIPLTEFTDSEGVFEFCFQTSESKIRIRVEANGYNMYDRRIDISSPRAIHDIRLNNTI
ncbi:carboxypeptidase-like regulatory domain-containing protein [Calothrix sp. PCC 6303]|uniref:carboxypeptidase-like regulatory domain-containing protein n=1 Tax=Calothrix sp. PCC 6303 TaxID=1170562 RepID=UPI0002A0386B|nr:carboxypeptidase-like regulatory domain-containing protein [Calothrix sp. PCC 6303]AFZ03030.1 hypothetical protein Cal6303_4116 [Calothrix sp. PCC 6303]